MALRAGQLSHGRRVEFEIVDRFGTGDAFLAGLLASYLDGSPLEAALDFGNACCALAHTIEGDALLVSSAEVHNFLKNGYDDRTRR